jgi:uncharacterized protein
MGSNSDWDLEQCVENVHEAAAELSDISGISRISIVGMRLGATIAYLASCKKLALDALVLWEPVVRGDEYVEQLCQRDLGKRLLGLLSRRRPAERTELCGFSWTSRMEQQMKAVNLFEEVIPAAARIGIVTSWPTAEHQHLHAHLVSRGAEASVHRTKDTGGSSLDEIIFRETAFLSSEALSAILTLVRHEGSP